MALLVILIAICIVFIVSFMLVWSLHITLSKDEDRPYDYVTFKTFIKVFEQYKYPITSIGNRGIYFSNNTPSEYLLYLTDTVVMIENKCMIFYPISYLRYLFFLREKTKQRNRVKGLWTNGKI